MIKKSKNIPHGYEVLLKEITRKRNLPGQSAAKLMMKKNTLIACFFLLIFIYVSSPVLAHPGRTDSAGCHTCRTNCSQWGLTDGEYHCHNGGSAGSSQPAYIPPPTNTPRPFPTWTPTPEPSATPTNTPTPKPTKIILASITPKPTRKPAVKKTVKKQVKKSFWDWLLGR